jgi:hypothetical protein
MIGESDKNQEVKNWLESQGLGELAELFVIQAIDLEILLSLDESDLEKIGVSALGHRRKILREIGNSAPNQAGQNQPGPRESIGGEALIPTAVGSPRRGGLVKKLVKGKYPLGRTFWLFIPFGFATSLIPLSVSQDTLLPMVLASILLPANLAWIGGIWRSAGPNRWRKFWGARGLSGSLVYLGGFASGLVVILWGFAILMSVCAAIC